MQSTDAYDAPNAARAAGQSRAVLTDRQSQSRDWGGRALLAVCPAECPLSVGDR